MKCKLCENNNLSTIYTVPNVPIFQNKVYATVSEAQNIMTGNVTLVMCSNCGFIFNADFDRKAMNYDAHYQNEQAHSLYFQKYLLELIDLFTEKKFHEMRIIEIGCGKGYFLEMLRKNGFDVTGFDPAYEGDSPYIVRDYYSEKYLHLNADLIVLRHTLEHIDAPLKFLRGIAHAVSSGPQIFIEVPSFEWILEKRAFWDIFYEHCNYFTFESMASLFQESEQGLLFNNQYMYLLADLSNLREQTVPTNATLTNFEVSKMLELLLFYREFVQSHSGMLVWGAGAKGVTFASLTDPNRNYISSLVDINPEKQGLYIAKTGHSVISPAQLADFEGGDILVMNDNYYQEIQKQIKGRRFNLYTLGAIQ